jgi:hypothetical protein
MTEAESYAIRTIWREERRTIADISRILPAGKDWRRWIKDRGFRRVPSYRTSGPGGAYLSQWDQGPCSSCGEVYPAGEIRDAVCLVCIECGPPSEEPSAVEIVRELYGVDLEAEKAAHRKRMAERAAGKRDPLPAPVVTRSSTGMIAGALRRA